MERIESDLPEIIKSANAKRVLIDPISILEALSLMRRVDTVCWLLSVKF